MRVANKAGMSTSTVERFNADVKDAVLHELKHDGLVDGDCIAVQVDEGVVRLTGTVTTWAARSDAARAAHRVAGVLDVANNIEVWPPGTARQPDAVIARAVRSALNGNAFVPASHITSTVSNGVVTLAGRVKSPTARYEAAGAVMDLPDVRTVVNLIAVEGVDAAPLDAES
jgi:osmotically-inducible protein OsmY